jgi:hypothetical protein
MVRDIELIVQKQVEKTEKQGGNNSENSADFFLLQTIVMCPKNIKKLCIVPYIAHLRRI